MKNKNKFTKKTYLVIAGFLLLTANSISAQTYRKITYVTGINEINSNGKKEVNNNSFFVTYQTATVKDIKDTLTNFWKNVPEQSNGYLEITFWPPNQEYHLRKEKLTQKRTKSYTGAYNDKNKMYEAGIIDMEIQNHSKAIIEIKTNVKNVLFNCDKLNLQRTINPNYTILYRPMPKEEIAINEPKPSANITKIKLPNWFTNSDNLLPA